MPVQIQKEYLLDMIRKYSTTASDLARLFGIGAPTVTKHCSSEEIGIKFSPGKKMPKDRREEFERLFLNEGEAEARRLLRLPLKNHRMSFRLRLSVSLI